MGTSILKLAVAVSAVKGGIGSNQYGEKPGGKEEKAAEAATAKATEASAVAAKATANIQPRDKASNMKASIAHDKAAAAHMYAAGDNQKAADAFAKLGDKAKAKAFEKATAYHERQERKHDAAREKYQRSGGVSRGSGNYGRGGDYAAVDRYIVRDRAKSSKSLSDLVGEALAGKNPIAKQEIPMTSRVSVNKELHPLVQDKAVTQAVKDILSEARDKLGTWDNKTPDFAAASKLIGQAAEVLATAPGAGGAAPAAAPEPADPNAAPPADGSEKRAFKFASPVTVTLWANSQFQAAKTETGAALAKRHEVISKVIELAKAHWELEGQSNPLSVEMESHYAGMPGGKADNTTSADQGSSEIKTPPSASSGETPSPTMKSASAFVWPLDLNALEADPIQKSDDSWGTDPTNLK